MSLCGMQCSITLTLATATAQTNCGSLNIHPYLPKAKPTQIYLINQPGATQAQIRVGQLGFPRKHGDFAVSRVINGYFGSFSGRLNSKIRVEKGLTYAVWGGYRSSKYAGSFGVGTFSRNATAAKAVRAVLDEIERLGRDGPSDEELSKTQSNILGSFAGKRENPAALANDRWTIELHGLADDHYKKLLASVAATTADRCAETVARTVDPSKMVIVVVGDSAKLKAGLEAIAPVTLVPAETPKDD